MSKFIHLSFVCLFLRERVREHLCKLRGAEEGESEAGSIQQCWTRSHNPRSCTTRVEIRNHLSHPDTPCPHFLNKLLHIMKANPVENSWYFYQIHHHFNLSIERNSIEVILNVQTQLKIEWIKYNLKLLTYGQLGIHHLSVSRT